MRFVSQRRAEAEAALTAKRLHELLSYDPETGDFFWRVRAARNVFPGQKAGTLTHFGYVAIYIDELAHKAHRLAWRYAYEAWPTHTIDHINGDRADNRIANLRDVTRRENRQNIHKAHRTNISGLLGAAKAKYSWRSSINVDGKRINLGSFKTPEEAHQAHVNAKRRFHPGNTL
jgi:hypothetical protein